MCIPRRKIGRPTSRWQEWLISQKSQFCFSSSFTYVCLYICWMIIFVIQCLYRRIMKLVELNELETMLKAAFVASCYLIGLEKLRDVTKDLYEGSRYPCPGSNWLSSKYKSEALREFCSVTVDNWASLKSSLNSIVIFAAQVTCQNDDRTAFNFRLARYLASSVRWSWR